MRAILVMGVSGVGKTSLGRALAGRLGTAFIEGDDLHPPENIARMRAGIPLDDHDRWPWLERVAAALGQAAGETGGVAACSALKRSYRDFIRSHLRVPLLLVYPALPRAEVLDRLRARKGHFMPASLLDSQFAALEPPAPDEHAIAVAAAQPLATQVEAVIAGIGTGLARSPATRD